MRLKPEIVEGRHVVHTEVKTFSFHGQYMPLLETENWHYYMITKGRRRGTLLHFRKQSIIAVESETKGEGNA